MIQTIATFVSLRNMRQSSGKGVSSHTAANQGSIPGWLRLSIPSQKNKNKNCTVCLSNAENER